MRRSKGVLASEDDIQKTVFQWLWAQPKIKDIAFHIPNGGKHSLSYGKRLKEMGVIAGVSDIFIMRARHNYHGAFLELKSESGKVAEHQKRFLKTAEREGYCTAVCFGLDEALKFLQWYLFAPEKCIKCGSLSSKVID